MNRSLEFAEDEARKYIANGVDCGRAIELAARRWNVGVMVLWNYMGR